MLRIADIQNRLMHLVGWQQSLNPNTRIPSELTESESGLTYQQVHPLLTLENVQGILPNETPTYPTWDASESYAANDIVSLNSVQYICREANTNASPDTDTDGKWGEYSPLGETLRNAVKGGVTQVASRFVSTKVEDGASKSLLENRILLDGAGRLSNWVVNNHKLVGYELEPLKGVGVTMQLNKIGLQMVDALGVVTLYLFHSSSSQPVATYNLNVTSNRGFQWFAIPDTFLRYIDTETDAGGAWYICYVQDDLPSDMKAVNFGHDFSQEPCPQCNQRKYEHWRNVTKYVRISPFRVDVDADFVDNPALFDLDDVEYTPLVSYGINIEFSVGCDLTDFIITQRQTFARVLQLQVAYDMLKRIAYNPDAVVNRNQSNVQRQDFLFEIDGNTYTKSTGIRGELERAYKELTISTDGMDSVCLACKKKGIFYGVA